MDHFNFFTDLQNTKRKNKGGLRKWFLLFLLVLMACAAAVFFFASKKAGLENQLSYLSDIKNNKDFNDNYNRSIEMASLAEAGERKLEYFNDLKTGGQKLSTVTVKLLDELTDCMPDGGWYDRVDVQDNAVRVYGILPEKEAALLLEKALRECGVFKTVFLKSIERDDQYASEDSNTVSFECELVLKEVKEDGQKQ